MEHISWLHTQVVEISLKRNNFYNKDKNYSLTMKKMTETELKKFTTRTCGQDLDKGSIIKIVKPKLLILS